MVCGIYKIVCRANGKIYIGQTKNMGNRKEQHWSALMRNHHKNKYLQADWNKYKGSFAFEIVELCPMKDLNNREKFWIDYYDALNSEKGYNISWVPYKRKIRGKKWKQ